MCVCGYGMQVLVGVHVRRHGRDDDALNLMHCNVMICDPTVCPLRSAADTNIFWPGWAERWTRWHSLAKQQHAARAVRDELQSFVHKATLDQASGVPGSTHIYIYIYICVCVCVFTLCFVIITS